MAVFVCEGYQAYAPSITLLPISSRESACACPPWYACLNGVDEDNWITVEDSPDKDKMFG